MNFGRAAGLVLAASLGSACVAQGQERSASATWTEDGDLVLSLDSAAPNGCYSKGPSETGAPDAATPIANAVAVSVHMEHSGADLCTTALVPMSWEITVDDVPPGVETAVIYEVDGGPRGGIQGYAVAIPDRP